METPIGDIPGIVASTRSAFKSRKTRGLEWRREQVEKLMELIQENKADIEMAHLLDLGAPELTKKPPLFFSRLMETGFVLEECELALRNLDNWAKSVKKPTSILCQPGSSYIVKEPLGTVLIIAPWNYPLGLTLLPLIQATTAGNAVIIKPSDLSTNMSALLTELIPRYLDRECIKVINGAAETTTVLLKERFDFIFYTGNGTVAKSVMAAAAKWLCPVSLELGGQCPAIVASDSTMDVMARRIVWGKYSCNIGQTCVSPNHVFVMEDQFDDVVKLLKSTIKEYFGENPRESPDYGRIINDRHCNRVAALLDDDTIEVLVGGEVHAISNYVAPTIVKATLESKCMKEEIFGPILPIISVPSVQDAIDIINEGEKPLALYLFTETNEIKELVVNQTSSGSVCINDTVVQVSNLELPFGGVGASGMGVYHGKYGFDTFSHAKPVVYRSSMLDSSLRYPPYDEGKIAHLNRLKKIGEWIPCLIQ